jgi:hypothetical protein
MLSGRGTLQKRSYTALAGAAGAWRRFFTVDEWRLRIERWLFYDGGIYNQGPLKKLLDIIKRMRHSNMLTCEFKRKYVRAGEKKKQQKKQARHSASSRNRIIPGP